MQLHVDEADVETGVVYDERRISDEAQKVVRDVGKSRLIGQKRIRQSVHGFRVGMHGAILGIDVGVKLSSRRKAIEQFDAAELDQPVAGAGIEPCRLSVEHDLAHGAPPSIRKHLRHRPQVNSRSARTPLPPGAQADQSLHRFALLSARSYRSYPQ